jgi:tetratricopeptide (TPR) repeat protein
MLDRVVEEFRGQLAVGVSEPQYQTGTAQFGDIVAEAMVFPTRPNADAEQVNQKMRDRAREFFEETWIRRPLKSLGAVSPHDAVSDPLKRKRLLGTIRFMEECLGGAAPRADATAVKSLYDFDRLRRKLGLAARSAAAGGDVDIDTLNVSALAALQPDALTDDRLSQAFQAALRLDASDLAAVFARHASARASIADRYPYFNHLIRAARELGEHDKLMELLVAGEQADAATNDSRRKDQYTLTRGQALARTGDSEGAYAVFKDAIDRSPNSLSLYAPATEAMLGRKQGSRALEFAELGLKQARAQNNRDAEQQFLELVAAAKKV